MADDEDHTDLDAVVHRADPDRWMASRFIADPQARAAVVALYALNDELARVAPAVRTPMLGEIRLAWWREALEELYEGRPPRRHPVVEGVAAAIARGGLPPDRLAAMIEARHADLDPPPFADEVSLHAWLDATAGGLMALAAGVLGARDALPAVLDAARAWGIANLARAHWAGAPNRLPDDWSAGDVRERVAELLARARPQLKTLPVGAFPAVAYVTLAEAYAGKRLPSPLSRQTRMLWAVARGRV